jgi:predicted transcriptional regulator
MKTNITLKLDKNLLRRIRVVAAERDTSVSALLADQLEQVLRQRDDYDKAKRRALTRMNHAKNLGYAPPASRDEFYER